MHLYITARALFGAFLAAITEFHFKRIFFTSNKRFNYSVVLAETPARAAVETNAAGHTSLRFVNRFVLAPGVGYFGSEFFESFLDWKALNFSALFFLIICVCHFIKSNNIHFWFIWYRFTDDHFMDSLSRYAAMRNGIDSQSFLT